MMNARSAGPLDFVSRWYDVAAQSTVYDTLTRLPAVLYFGTLLSLQVGSLAKPALVDGQAVEAMTASQLLARVAVICLMATMAWLTIVRHRPVARAAGLWPRMTALLGSVFFFSVVLLPRAEQSHAFDLASAALILAGNILTLVVVWRLGRSFSTMAEARSLVVDGPYRWVRHPLYAAEQIAVIGMFLQYRSLAAVLIVAVHLLLQLARMRNEEAILAQSFPEYLAYRERTARLIPGIY